MIILTVIWVIASILLIIIAVLILVLFIPTDAGIEFLMKDNTKKMYLHLRLFNIISLKIPLLLKNKTKMKKEKDEASSDNKKKLGIKDYINLAKSIKEAYNENREEIKDIANDFKKEVTFKEVTFEVLFSTGNAASTGIMTGAVWTTTSFLAKLADEIFGIGSINLNVIPTFNEKCFNIYLKSILRLKVVNIIFILSKILKIINIFKNIISTNKEKAVL